jgi:hypothetical protein
MICLGLESSLDFAFLCDSLLSLFFLCKFSFFSKGTRVYSEDFTGGLLLAARNLNWDSVF